MPPIQWTDALTMGIQTLDQQHKGLFELYEGLCAAQSEAGPTCTSQELLEALRAYAEDHFHIEEGYMQAFGYPDFDAHTAEHEAFLLDMGRFEAACDSGDASVQDMLDYLGNWLVEHIQGVDMKMGRFLEEHLR